VGADSLRAFLRGQAEVARENGRTPMQWSAGRNAGFTTGSPWLPVNDNHDVINVESAERDTGSVLHYFRRMVRLRRAEPALVYGRYQLLDRDNPEVFAYTRSLGGRTLLVALSFSATGGRMTLPAGRSAGRTLINNLATSPVRGDSLALGPYQAVVLELTRR
jgi:oligo-1,6-glucosidase